MTINMKPLPTGKATDVLCRMFSTKFTDVDISELQKLISVLQSIRVHYGDKNAGTFKVIISILYEHFNEFTNNLDMEDYSKTVKFIKMLLVDHPELANYLIALLRQPTSNSSCSSLSRLTSLTSRVSSVPSSPSVSISSTQAYVSPCQPSPVKQKGKNIRPAYKFYNYTPPDISSYVASKGKPQKLEKAYTYARSSPVNKSKKSQKTETLKKNGWVEGEDTMTSVKQVNSESGNGLRPNQGIKPIAPLPVTKLSCIPPQSSTPQLVLGTMVQTTGMTGRLAAPIPIDKTRIMPVLRPVEMGKNLESKKIFRTEEMSFQSRLVGSDAATIRTFPYTQHLMVNACNQNYMFRAGNNITNTTLVPNTCPLVYVQGMGPANVRPPVQNTRPGNSVLYRLAFPVAARSKAFNCSSMRPLLIKKGTGTTSRLVSTSTTPSVPVSTSQTELIKKEEQPLDLSMRKMIMNFKESQRERRAKESDGKARYGEIAAEKPSDTMAEKSDSPYKIGISHSGEGSAEQWTVTETLSSQDSMESDTSAFSEGIGQSGSDMEEHTVSAKHCGSGKRKKKRKCLFSMRKKTKSLKQMN